MAHRYLLMGSGKTVNVMWLDEDGSCSAHHGNLDGSLSATRFHIKLDEKGRRWPLICPNGLATIEWDRVKVGDNWREELLEFQRSRLAAPAKARRSSDEDWPE